MSFARLSFLLSPICALLACGAAWADPDPADSGIRRKTGTWVAAYSLNVVNATQFPYSSKYTPTPRMHYYLRPWLALDGWLTVGNDWEMNLVEIVGGIGLMNDSKLGLGIRVTPLPYSVTPCASVGVDLATGTFGRKSEEIGTYTSEDITVVIGPSASGQVSGGLEFMGRNGLFILGQAHYQRLLTSENVRFLGKEPRAHTRREFTSLYDGRLTLSIAIGKAFGR